MRLQLLQLGQAAEPARPVWCRVRLLRLDLPAERDGVVFEAGRLVAVLASHKLVEDLEVLADPHGLLLALDQL